MKPIFLVVFADWIFLSPFWRASLSAGFLERAGGRVISSVLMQFPVIFSALCGHLKTLLAQQVLLSCRSEMLR